MEKILPHKGNLNQSKIQRKLVLMIFYNQIKFSIRNQLR